jgi:hypothetical protein
MSHSRRELIKLGTLAGAAALMPFSDVLTPEVEALTVWPVRSQFLAQLKKGFTVVKPPKGKAFNLYLAAVQDVPSARTAGAVGHQDCFVLVLRADLKTPKLGQNTFRLKNAGLGALDLFLVPAGDKTTGRFYTATFNRLTA